MAQKVLCGDMYSVTGAGEYVHGIQSMYYVYRISWDPTQEVRGQVLSEEVRL